MDKDSRALRAIQLMSMDTSSEALSTPADTLNMDEGTKQILDNLEAEGHTIENDPRPKPPVKPEEAEAKAKAEAEAKAQADVKAKADADAKAKEEVKPSPRQPRYIPAYRLEIEQDKFKKDLEAKDKAIADLQVALKDRKPDPDSEKTPELDATLDEIAKKHDLPVDFIKDLAKVLAPKAAKTEMPAEVTKLLEEQRVKEERHHFDDDFRKTILPLVKAEYPDISDEKLAEVQEDLHNLAYTTKHGENSLAFIYKGDDDFRGLVQPKKVTAEEGKQFTGSGGKVVNFESATDEDIAAMDLKTFAQYSNWQASREINRPNA